MDSYNEKWTPGCSSGMSYRDIQGKKMKSGLHRHQETQVLVNINWPHEFCFTQDRSCPAYDDLSQMQFTQGFIVAFLKNLM